MSVISLSFLRIVFYSLKIRILQEKLRRVPTTHAARPAETPTPHARNSAGLSTRYAHMTQTAVPAGEAVTAGQVIGYVGNTGDSTGNHLHFEVMQNGVRVNPMDMVSVR